MYVPISRAFHCVSLRFLLVFVCFTRFHIDSRRCHTHCTPESADGSATWNLDLEWNVPRTRRRLCAVWAAFHSFFLLCFRLSAVYAACRVRCWRFSCRMTLTAAMGPTVATRAIARFRGFVLSSPMTRLVLPLHPHLLYNLGTADGEVFRPFLCAFLPPWWGVRTIGSPTGVRPCSQFPCLICSAHPPLNDHPTPLSTMSQSCPPSQDRSVPPAFH